MNTKQKKTLLAIFKNPINGNLIWSDIESLLRSLGCRVIEGSGSSVTFELEGKRAYFHRPHPQKESLKYRVKAVKEFLISIGVKP